MTQEYPPQQPWQQPQQGPPQQPQPQQPQQQPWMPQPSMPPQSMPPQSMPQPYAGQQAVPQPYPAWGAKPARPDLPRAYPQLLRGPKHAWWRPLVSLGVMLGFVIVLFVVLVVVSLVAFAVLGASLDELETTEAMMREWGDEPLFLLFNNLFLAAFIPLSTLTVWIAHGWRPRWVTSVVGGMRWKWLVVTSAVALAVQVVAMLVLYAIDGFPSGVGTNVVWLLVVVFLTTPLQAAGEEYFFRGWLTQSIGSWIPAALVSALVTAALASTLFAMAHGSQNVWLFLDRFAFGVLASYLTWRTGGLEAAIGTHTVNNVVVFVPTILTGGMASVLEATAIPGWMVGADIAAMVVIGLLVVVLARRMGIEREYVPATTPSAGASPPPGWPPGPLPAPDQPGGPLLAPPRPLG